MPIINPAIKYIVFFGETQARRLLDKKQIFKYPLCESKHKEPHMSNELAGKTLNASDLIAYQEGSVVSRTIAKKKSGTVTVFAFDAGEGLSEHTAPFDAIVHILDGEAEVVISGEKLTAKAGELVIMPANEPHSLQAVTRFKMMLIMIRE